MMDEYDKILVAEQGAIMQAFEGDKRQGMERREAVQEACEYLCATVTKLEGSVDKGFAVLDLRVGRVEEGVSNYRDFQVEARKFFVENTTQRAAEIDFRNCRDQEIREALEKHYRASTLRISIVGAAIALAIFLLALTQFYLRQ
jgi:hypothetical protein